MLKQFLIYLLLSVLIVVLAKYAHLLIVSVDMLYVYINSKLIPIFSQSGIGTSIRKTLILVFLPIAITAIPALIYRVIKGGVMPHFIAITWMIWIIVVLSDVLIRLG